jgi:hypothetical protein
VSGVETKEMEKQYQNWIYLYSISKTKDFVSKEKTNTNKKCWMI